MAEACAVERQRVNGFERPRLELLAVVAGDRRPAQHIAREQRRDPYGPVRCGHFQRHVPGNQEVEEAGVVAFLEDQLSRGEMRFGGHRREPRDVFGPEGLREGVFVKKDGFAHHGHLCGVVYKHYIRTFWVEKQAARLPEHDTGY